MMRNAGLGVVVLLAALSAGCVERRYTIYSDPPGAMVYRNGVQLGPTPVDDYFVYYGQYQFVLVKEGYETLVVKQKIPAPWFQWPGVDFFTENVYPGKLRDVRCFTYTLQPLQPTRPDDLLSRARDLRSRGQTLGAPRQAPAPPPAPPGPAAPEAPPVLPPPRIDSSTSNPPPPAGK
jgi:hypothetical protein